jgi:hypothetical protein
MDEFLDFIVSQNFNAIRVPLSLNIALDFNLPQAPGNNDPTLQGLNAVRSVRQLLGVERLPTGLIYLHLSLRRKDSNLILFLSESLLHSIVVVSTTEPFA